MNWDTSIPMGKKWMQELEDRYQSGEIDKTQYLIAKGKLQDKIKAGKAIKRTPFGMFLKVFLVVVLVGSGVATINLAPGMVGFLWGAVLIVSAVWVIWMP